MKITTMFFVILAFTVGINSTYGQKTRPFSEDDEKVYDGRIQRVKGKVVFLKKDNEKVPATGQYLVFQRDGCKDCLVGTETDSEGNYKLFLGVGRYKLIVQSKNCGYAPTQDCAGHNYLAARQPQYLVVEYGPLYSGEFNIELVSPKH
jgi:hypothetical protein